MNIYQLIANSIKPHWVDLPETPVMEICAFTGEKTLCISRKKVLSSAFTEQPVLACPESQFVSVETFQALKYPKERKSSWLVNEKEFKLLYRLDVRQYVLNGVESAIWAGWATTSYKKHGALRTPINTGEKAVWAFNDILVDCSDNQKVNHTYNKLTNYLKAGLSRNTLETLDCPVFVLKKLGIKIWLDFHDWAKSEYKSNLYKFLCYLLPSQEELKAEGWKNPVKK